MFSACTFAADRAAEEALKANGLAGSGSAYVLSDELDILKEMPALRKAKKEFEADARARNALELQIKASRLFVAQSIKEHDQLNDRLSVVTDRTAHNRLVLRMNQLLIKIKESMSSRKEAEEKLAKHDSSSGTQYVDDVMALDAKAQAATKKYEQLAADPAVKSAVDKAGRGANPALKLGPSAEFVAAAAELAKYQSEIESQAIPLTEEGGIQTLSVLLNGEPVKMIFDPGASLVTLPREVAEKLKMIPGPKDPTLEMKLADGHIIQVQQMTLKSVRVGRFTVENVSCAVMGPGLRDVTAILGNSFLSHFVVKFDQKAGQLRLTEVEAEKKPATAVPVTGIKPTTK